MALIMVVAGGDWQVDLVKKIKEMGHSVICSNLYHDSPAFKYSDYCEVADIRDKKRNLLIAKEYHPDAVVTDQSDLAVPTVAYVNEEMNLQGIGIEKAKLFTDKSLQREKCAECGIAIPEYRVCKSAEDAYSFLDKHKRIIIKPVDSQSSRGVFTIDDRAMLDKHWHETVSFSSNNQYLAEEYINGSEFTIDGIVIRGKHYPLCVSIKEMFPSNANISLMQTYTYYSKDYDYDLLRETNSYLIDTLGLGFGLTHSEYKYFNNQFYLIEASARGGGSNLSSRIVPFVSNIDNYEILIRESLGESIDTDQLFKNGFPINRSCIMRFFNFGEGIVKKVVGIERVIDSPFLLDYQLKIKIGDSLTNPKFGRARPGHFIIGSEDFDGLKKEAAELVKAVKVEFL